MRTTVVTILLATAAIALAGSPAEAGGGCHADEGEAAVTVATGTTVTLETCAFAPTVLHVPVGATVTFANDSGVPHTVTGPAGSLLGDAAFATGHRTWTATEPGVHPFACVLHPGMVGALVVGDPDVPIARADLANAVGTPGAPTRWLVLALVGPLVAVALLGVARVRRRASAQS